MSNPYSPVMKGSGGQTTIAQANIAQTLLPQSTLVKSAQIYPDPSVVGEVLMSYGCAPYLPSLSLPPAENKYYDLSLVQIKSTEAGDKVNYNCIYSF